MSNVFITSDEHIGHRRIIELAKRPFSSLEEMREIIIQRHNKKVPNSPNYCTIHVGDMLWFTLTEQEALTYIDRLNGKHAFVYGNHDELIEGSAALRAKFLWIVGVNKASGTKIINHNKHKLIIDHFSKRVWDGSHKGHWHVYGHSHNALPGLGKSFDIGVDGNHFTPWSLEEIEAKMDTLMQHHTIDNTGRGTADNVNHNALAVH